MTPSKNVDHTHTHATAKPGAFDTIVLGGLLAGTLDAMDGVVASGFNGMNPIQVLQYIASGLLGAPSFQGGFKTAALGAVLHYFISFAVAAIYYAASLKLPVLHLRPVKWGLTYGVAVFLVMNYVVLPLSAIQIPQCGVGVGVSPGNAICGRRQWRDILV